MESDNGKTWFALSPSPRTVCPLSGSGAHLTREELAKIGSSMRNYCAGVKEHHKNKKNIPWQKSRDLAVSSMKKTLRKNFKNWLIQRRIR